MCDDKAYCVFESHGRKSRPFLPELFEADPKRFARAWDALGAAAQAAEHRLAIPAVEANRTIYSAITSFCACYDLWKPESRKTPGTFFEAALGTILQPALVGYTRGQHIVLPNQTEKVSTDIVFNRPGSQPGGLVIPAKITTRERIGQPFAHQRILNSVFGEGAFESILVCVSEMQRDGDDGANAICVPGAIRLYQMHLAKLSGIYYLDPPRRYLQRDVSSVIKVSTLGDLLTVHLPDLI